MKKDETKKIYQQKSNQIIDYINVNLHNPLQLNLIANRVNISKRQLLRIMSFHLNEPLYTYINRLRTERAIMYMQTEKMSLTKLANMVGYETAQSFSKAFKKHYKISPKKYIQKLDKQLRECTKTSISDNITIQSEEVLAEKINLVYIRIIGKYGENEAFQLGWAKLTAFLQKHDSLDKSTRFVGISFDDPNVTQYEKCRFYACASINDNFVAEGEFGAISIDRGKYAVYTLNGSYTKLQELYNKISLDNRYEIRRGVAFEEYMNSTENTKEEDLITKIFIPIK